MVLGKGIVKGLLGQLTEQMSGVSRNPRVEGRSLRKSEPGTLKHVLISSLLLSEH